MGQLAMSNTPRTDPKMNEDIVDILRLNGANYCLYAAARIEELELENARQQMELDASCNAEELRQVRAENARLREVLDPDSLIAACVPGGDICDPQQVADNIREHLTKDTP
jgi:hypothetical protein